MPSHDTAHMADDKLLAHAWKEYTRAKLQGVSPKLAEAHYRGFCGGVSFTAFIVAKLCEAEGVDGVMQFVRDLAPELSAYHRRYPQRRG